MNCRIFVIVLLMLILPACGGGSSSQDSEASPENPVVQIDDIQTTTKTYTVTLTSLWDPDDHLGRPATAHFSDITAVNHSSEYRLLPLGSNASAGFENVAELGNQTVLVQEAEAAQAEGHVDNIVQTPNQFVPGTLTQSFEIEINPAHPLISFVSMIAPSPDWVIGLDSVALYGESGFSDDTPSFQLYAIDGGTEEGDTPGNFSLSNSETSPQTPIDFLDQSIDGFDKPFARVDIAPLDSTR